MITVKTESNADNGLVRRRYEVTLTDNNGKPHVEVVGMFNHTVDNDGSEVEAQLLATKKTQEVERYKAEIKAGLNPFVELTRSWNTRAEMLKAVLDEALSLEATNAMVHNGLPYLHLVTDDELKALYNKGQTWVDDVRAKAADLLTAKAILDNYQAVL